MKKLLFLLFVTVSFLALPSCGNSIKTVDDAKNAVIEMLQDGGMTDVEIISCDVDTIKKSILNPEHIVTKYITQVNLPMYINETAAQLGIVLYNGEPKAGEDQQKVAQLEKKVKELCADKEKEMLQAIKLEEGIYGYVYKVTTKYKDPAGIENSSVYNVFVLNGIDGTSIAMDKE